MAELSCADVDNLFDMLIEIKEHATKAKEKAAIDIDVTEWKARVKAGVKSRKEEAFKSEEFVYDSDSSDSGEVDEAVSDLEEEIIGEAGSVEVG
jgi:hypothetical protein